MKPTGKFMPDFLGGKEIMKVEEHDIDFWGCDWEELTLEQKADYCSFREIEFLSPQNEDTVKALFLSDQAKNNYDL